MRGWYPVALSQDIEPGTSAGTRIEGKEIVVWRDEGGAIHAWEDRCPHRGMKLSFGFVRGDHIACLYHGWRYDTGGRCRYIPAHPDLEPPATITVPTYRVAEAGGMVFARLDGEAVELPPDAPATPVRSVFLFAAPQAVTAALAERGARAAGPHVHAVVVDGLDARVGVQPVAEDRTALHLALAGAAAPAPARHAMAAWAAALRLSIEAASRKPEAA